MLNFTRPLALAALLLAGCATTGRQAAPAGGTGFIAFGDTGYSLDYLDPEDLTPPKSEAQFIADARAK